MKRSNGEKVEKENATRPKPNASKNCPPSTDELDSKISVPWRALDFAAVYQYSLVVLISFSVFFIFGG